MEYVMRIDPELKLNRYGKGKYLLRHAFEGDYLPHDILYREKAAFSDAAGHSMVDYLKDYAEHRYTDQAFEEKRRVYQPACGKQPDNEPASQKKQQTKNREVNP